MKRWVVLLLIGMLTLSGCVSHGNGESSSGTDDVRDGVEQAYRGSWGSSFSFNMSLRPEWMALKGNTFYYVDQLAVENGLWLEFYCVEKGQTIKKLCEIEGSLSPNCIGADEQGFLYCFYTDIAVGMKGEGPLHLVKVDSEGAVVYDETVAGPADEEEIKTERMTDTVITADGQICACSRSGRVYFFHDDGELAYIDESEAAEIETASDYGLADAGADGCYWYALREGTLILRKLELETGVLGEVLSVPMEDPYLAICDGEGGIVFEGRDALSLYKPDAGESEELLRWDNRGVGVDPSQIASVSMAEDGEITCLFSGRTGLYQWISLERKEAVPEPDESHTLRLGVLEEDVSRMENILTEFIRRNPEYDVELATYDMGWTEFSLELLKGDGPDLISLDCLDVETLTNLGVLEDLTPYLAASEKVKETDLLPCVRRAMSVQGQMVRVPDQIIVSGMMVKAGTTRNGAWTAEEYLALGEQGEDGAYLEEFMYALGLYRTVIEPDLSSYVDWERLECDFTEGRFTRLLERIAGLQTEDTGLTYGAGKDRVTHLRNGQTLTMPWDVTNVRELLILREACGDGYEFAGYPGDGQTPHYLMQTAHMFGMNSASGKKEAAWAFLEFLLSDDYQRYLCDANPEVYMPIREDVLQSVMDGDYSPYLPGREVELQNPYDPKQVTRYPDGVPGLTQEEQEELRQILDWSYMSSSRGGVVADIIWEELQAFFAGDKTADKTAEVIQNRVSLYLNEMK